MENSLDMQEMLEQFQFPAFLVKDGIITQANRASLLRQIEIGSAVESIIKTGNREYADFSQGKLCLTLSVGNITYHTSVTKSGDFDLFCMESEYEGPELRALALAAQQLREPLSNAMLCTDNLLKDSPECQQQLQQINRSLYQLHRALSNMSDAAEYTKQRPFKIETKDVCGVIEELMEKAAHLASEAGYTLTFKGLNKVICCPIDSEKLERGILNLISNAIKFSSGSDINASLSCNKNRLYLTICNASEAIPADTRSNLFSRFLREPGIEDGRHGIGLGMTIVRSVAAGHGGTVLFEQTEENGIRFTLTLDIQQSSDVYVRSPVLLPTNYSGGYDPALVELSDILPPHLYP